MTTASEEFITDLREMVDDLQEYVDRRADGLRASAVNATWHRTSRGLIERMRIVLLLIERGKPVKTPGQRLHDESVRSTRRMRKHIEEATTTRMYVAPWDELPENIKAGWERQAEGRAKDKREQDCS